MSADPGDGPEIGDLVEDGEGHRRVVTDILQGERVILRPATGPYRELHVDEPAVISVIARRGCWR
ncbi:hypothetical protein ACEZCY_16380 [Streptacidiphilus sp. N1-12]|uniref:Uncharacterized protein n=2 Tax=Streptacidiphilus alkalitolerans TaxID=3342712 RepID=A0ABV6VAL5_9ACTN